jgi:hypothetical protein
MTTYVRAPASGSTAGSSQSLDVKFNEDVFVHTAGSSTQAELSSLTISGMEDYELTWFGLAIGGNTSDITSTTFDVDIDNSNMTKAFDSSTGCDFDLTISKSAPSDTQAPDMLDRVFPIVESDYATFSNATASTYSEAFKEIWTGGKLRNDTSDDAYSSYGHSGFTLDFANSPMGTGGHRFSNDDTNILFLGFWGPGRYVKEAAKRIKIRPTSNTSTEYVLMACVRTETTDTAFSPVARLREATGSYASLGVTIPGESGASFIFDKGEENDTFTATHKDSTTGLLDNVVYPHTSLIQLSYPRPSTFTDEEDTTTFSFIYEGKKVTNFTAGPSNPGEDPTIGSDAHSSTTALVAHDYITNKRYGMGEMILDVNTTGQANGNEQAAKINNQLYEAKIRCEDALTITATDGTTSTQNRYAFNSVIDSDSDKFETLSKILNNMHSDFYFHNGFLNIYQDKPTDPVKIVNQSNAQNIKFTGRNHLPEVNTMYVKYNNERKMFRQDIAFDELRDQLNTGMPVVSKEVITEGITNKHQALRHSRYLLENARTKNEFVSYTAGADHIYMKPGDLIYADSTEDNGKKHSGRILSISSTTATIDGAIEINGSKGYRVLIENGFTGSNQYNAHEQTVVNNTIFETNLVIPFSGTTTPQTTLQLGSVTGLNDINAGKSALTDFNGQAFILIEDTSPATKPYQQEKIYKITSITETSPFVYEVVAQRYDQNKWITIDEGYFFGYDLTESLASGYTET